jgi:hypothetical protein
MAKTKISEFDANPDNNTDINSINIAEGCAPSGINNAIRQLMSDLKDWYAGSSGDSLAVGGGGTGSTTASGARTNLGLAIGTDVQAYDAQLADIAGLTPTDNAVIIGNGTNFVAESGSTLRASLGLAIGTDVQAYDADLTTWAGKTAPTGDVVGTSDTQTLSNKTITNLIMDGYIREEVFAVSGTTPALSPSNGTIQTWTLSGNSTPTQGTWTQGESMTLMINDGSASTVTWTSVPVVWVGGAAPTLATTGYTVIELWEVGTTVYGALVGNVA